MMGFFDIMRCSLAQYVLGFASALLFTLNGVDSGLSALAGGMSYAVPSSVLALSLIGLSKSVKNKQGASVFVLFGEMLKIVLCICILWCVAANFKGLQWLPLLTSLAVVSFGSNFVLIKRK